MKILTELFSGTMGLLGGEKGGSRKLETAVIGSTLAVAYPESALGIGIAVAGYCIGTGWVDAKAPQ